MTQQPTPNNPFKYLADKRWRLNNLYKIINAEGREIDFVMNEAQNNLYENLHNFNIILKARQLGFSTFILIYILDTCLFRANTSAGVIAQGLNEAEDLFRNKVKFAYDKLPDPIRLSITATQNTARKLEFSNGSSISVGTSLRGGTNQILHVSEYGKISARYPDKAREIKTGALNTVHTDQLIFIESTAEGQQGEFYDYVQMARRLKQEDKELTSLDPKIHFYPWYDNKEYKLKADVSITREMADYFDSLPVVLTPDQKSWYVKKAEQMGDDMKREFPASPEEAFEQSMEGAYYTKQMDLVRKNKQIGHVPYEPSKPVYTFWDLGLNDMMCIWFFQHIGNQYRFIDYYENYGEGLQHYASYLASLGYTYIEHVWPHDGNNRDLSTGKERSETARALGINPLKIVPRTVSVNDDIQLVRNILPRCWFDARKCDKGIKHLDNYRKEWDDRLGVWKNKPLHDSASHGADAFRTFVKGYNERQIEFYDTSLPAQAQGYDMLNW